LTLSALSCRKAGAVRLDLEVLHPVQVNGPIRARTAMTEILSEASVSIGKIAHEQEER
jgi:hypothetical protein